MANAEYMNTETRVISIISSLVSEDMPGEITLGSKLKHDLGLDSLNMLELCVAIESAFKVSIQKDLTVNNTVADVIEHIENGTDRRVADRFNVDDYPLRKTESHIRKLKQYMRLSRLLWRFEVSGVEHVPARGRYILCPNHQSYLDCLWVWTAIGHKRVDLWKICCLAAEVFVPRKHMLTLLGGIPVDRRGNTVPAMQRALASIQDGYTVLIHPEGTRTRDGKMGEFKGGAAKLAIDATVPIIPVRIDGAWDIFPPHKKLPKIFRIGRRYPIRIQFGKPIEPDGKNVEELTAQLQGEVERMGEQRSIQ